MRVLKFQAFWGTARPLQSEAIVNERPLPEGLLLCSQSTILGYCMRERATKCLDDSPSRAEQRVGKHQDLVGQGVDFHLQHVQSGKTWATARVLMHLVPIECAFELLWHSPHCFGTLCRQPGMPGADSQV